QASKQAARKRPSPAAAEGSSKRRSTRVGEPINTPPAFLAFVTAHQLGASVEATVIEFSSHGAYVDVNGARCYVPLKSMGDPAPRSAREVLDMGETRTFIVQSFDTPRRGIDLVLAGPRPVGATQAVSPSS